MLEPEAVDVESALRQAVLDATERLQRKLSDFLVAAEPGLPRARRPDPPRADSGRPCPMRGPRQDGAVSPPGRRVRRARRRPPDLTVADGARLFDPLAANGEDGATRVRLALARALATLSGGELTVTAGEVTGTVFTLTLPAATRGDGLARPRVRPLTDA